MDLFAYGLERKPKVITMCETRKERFDVRQNSSRPGTPVSSVFCPILLMGLVISPYMVIYGGGTLLFLNFNAKGATP